MHSLWTGSKRGGCTFFPELAEGADGSGRCSRGAKKAAVRESFVHRKGNDHKRGSFIADIHFDAVYEEEFDRSDDDEGKSEYSYYVQFSTPELAPCDRDCETSAGQYDRVEELLKNGQHEGKILWGRKKKSNYYYAFAPKNGDITAMLGKRLLENFICYGESTEKRKLAPKGGAGNTTYDKVFDAIWDNTIGKL